MPNSERITLKVEPYKNRGGSISHRVTGSIHGRRLQKNFPSFADAERKMNELKDGANQGDSSLRRKVFMTLKTDCDPRDAEFAMDRLMEANPKVSLVAAVE
jgi:hypothetical protein